MKYLRQTDERQQNKNLKHDSKLLQKYNCANDVEEIYQIVEWKRRNWTDTTCALLMGKGQT